MPTRARQSECLESCPPSFGDAEATILASILAFPEHMNSFMALNELKMRDFYHPAHKEIFSAIMAIHNTGQIPDGVMVTQYLNSTGSDITEAVYNLPDPSPDNLRHYIDELKRYTSRREARAFSLGLIENSQDISVPIEETLANALDTLTTIASGTSGLEIISIQDSMRATFDGLMSRQDSGSKLGASTGFPAFDSLFGGFVPGEYLICAARPGMGKTAMVLDMALHVAKTKPVYFCTLEMSIDELNQRILSKKSGVPLQHLRNGGLTRKQCDQITEAAGETESLQLYKFESRGLTPSQIYLGVKKHMTLHKIQPALVVVDYLGLVSPENRLNSREREVAEMSRLFKIYAQELKTTFLVVAQLNRESERRDDRAPRLADLRESGAIEQDANVVLGLYRRAYYQNQLATSNEATCLILKNRSGPCQNVQMFWEPDTATFRSLSARTDADIAATPVSSRVFDFCA